MNQYKYYSFHRKSDKIVSLISILLFSIAGRLLIGREYVPAMICFILSTVYLTFHFGFPRTSITNVPWDKVTLSISTGDQTVQLLVNNKSIYSISGNQLSAGICLIKFSKYIVFSSAAMDNQHKMKELLRNKKACCVPYDKNIINDFPKLFLKTN